MKLFKFLTNRKENELLNYDYTKLKMFSIKGEFLGKVIDVVDGDTFTVIFKYHNEMVKNRIRLLFVDAPEINTKDLEIKKRGLDTKYFLEKLILNKLIKFRTDKQDGFGRMLAEVFFNDDSSESINNLLIKNGYALYYKNYKKK
uniref:TNase-like domain-containing protein n=1 Tax=viral metagenome TaxID=1070528 RepID=A0A6C0JSD0_9ZZZZ